MGTNGDESGSAEVEGCVDLKGGFSVNAGAQGSFFDIFNDKTQVSIFSKEFELFQVSKSWSYDEHVCLTKNLKEMFHWFNSNLNLVINLNANIHFNLYRGDSYYFLSLL